MSNFQNKNRKKILLVDDDRLFLHVMTRYLKEFGYDCIVAEEGQQAWEYLHQYTDEFFVVLSDRIMPKLHGLELLARMKQAGFNIPLILVTGEASKEERCDALRQGVYDFFYKPIYKELLLAVLKKIEG